MLIVKMEFYCTTLQSSHKLPAPHSFRGTKGSLTPELNKLKPMTAKKAANAVSRFVDCIKIMEKKRKRENNASNGSHSYHPENSGRRARDV